MFATAVQKSHADDRTTTTNSQRNSKGVALQAKTTIGKPNDKYEREADRIADQVMRMPDRATVLRKCAGCEEKEKIQQKPLAARITPYVQRQAKGEPQVSASLESRLNSSKSGGRSLPGKTRSFMENRIGADFSNVKVHTDSNAVQMSRELGAQAFTHSNHIYFNAGKYNPESASGKHLLAHEMVHTLHQSGNANDRNVQRKWIQRESEPNEQPEPISDTTLLLMSHSIEHGIEFMEIAYNQAAENVKSIMSLEDNNSFWEKITLILVKEAVNQLNIPGVNSLIDMAIAIGKTSFDDNLTLTDTNNLSQPLNIITNLRYGLRSYTNNRVDISMGNSNEGSSGEFYQEDYDLVSIWESMKDVTVNDFLIPFEKMLVREVISEKLEVDIMRGTFFIYGNTHDMVLLTDESDMSLQDVIELVEESDGGMEMEEIHKIGKVTDYHFRSDTISEAAFNVFIERYGWSVEQIASWASGPRQGIFPQFFRRNESEIYNTEWWGRPSIWKGRGWVPPEKFLTPRPEVRRW